MTDKSLPWFRYYTETMNDRKMTHAARLCGASKLEIIGAWSLILCAAGESPVRGALYVTLQKRYSNADVTDLLGCDEDQAKAIMSAFVEMEMLEVQDDAYHVKNWDKRQFTAEYHQQERHREKREALGLPRRRWINEKVRDAVMQRDGEACVYCSSETNLTLDHIIPEIKGGDNSESNLVVACRACNAKKREFTIEQAGMSYRPGYIPPVKQAPSKPLASTDTESYIYTDTKDSSGGGGTLRAGKGGEVFRVYEQEMGPLTPMIVDAIKDMQDTYPHEWIIRAFETSARNNKRSMAYAGGILKRWKVEGFQPMRNDRPPAPRKGGVDMSALDAIINGEIR